MIKHTLVKTGFVAVHGGEIHFRYYEPHNLEKSALTPVLYIHGGPGASHALLYEGLSELVDERPALFYDQLGSRFSPAEMTDDLMTVERYADEISRLLEALQFKKVIVLGHSWGGALAAFFALQHPEQVEALVLSSPLLSSQRWVEDCRRLLASFPQDQQDTVARCDAGKEATDSPAYKAVDATFFERHVLRSPVKPEVLTKHFGELAWSVYTYMWGPSEFSCSGSLKSFDLFPRLSEIKVPTLLNCGFYDSATPETLEAARDLVRGSVLNVIPEAGHLAFLDAPEAFVASVKKFWGLLER